MENEEIQQVNEKVEAGEQQPELENQVGEAVEVNAEESSADKDKKAEAKEKTPIWQRITSIASWVLLGITLLVMIFTIFSSLVFNKDDKKVFGVSMMVVMSDSMKKTDFAAGDLIFIQDVNPKDLKVGDIICFTSQNPGSMGETVTHKIREIKVVPEKVTHTNDKGESVTETVYVLEFTTYGTTTGTDDAVGVRTEWIKGKYVGKIPWVGHVFNFLKTPAGYVCIILIPFVLLIAYQVFNAIRAFRSYRGEQTSVIKQERTNLKKEREENLKMLEEMRALKAQLDAMKMAQTAPQTAGVATNATEVQAEVVETEEEEKKEESEANQDSVDNKQE